MHSGVAKVLGAPVQKYVPGTLAPLVQIGVVNFKEVRDMHLDKFGFGNGISRILTSLLDKMYMVIICSMFIIAHFSSVRMNL